MIYSITLSKDELLYILVLYGVEDEEKYIELGLKIEDTTKGVLENGKRSLISRDILTEQDGFGKYLKDDSIALVAIVLNQNKIDNEYFDEESGLRVKVLSENNMYLFKGSI